MQRFAITFVNYDGAELQKSDWDYGSTPVYGGEAPKREKTAQYSYAWKGWNPEIVPVSVEATYTAVFESAVNEYVVTFESNGGTAVTSETKAYGSKADQPADPTKEGATFQGWYKDEALTLAWDFNADIVEGNVSLYAKWEVNTFTVTFLNWDGNELYVDVNVAYGTAAEYKGSTPTKPGDVQYSYAFDKWDTDYSSVKENLTVTATYKPSVNQYTVTFVNEDGTELQKSDWDYGSTPVYHGDIPTKANDETYHYFFSGWTPEIAKVTAAATYTAVFAKEAKGTEGLTYKLASDGKSYSVSKYRGTATNVIIPTKYNGLPVASIGDYAFYFRNVLASVTIPDSVETIGDYAFSDCTGLTSITIPSSVTSIGDYAFSDCTALTSIAIPDSVTSIGDCVFRTCTGLTSISVDLANPNYQSIDGVLLSKDGKALHTYPAGKSGTSYVIPSSVTSVGDLAFFWCKTLASIVIPDSVTSIGQGVFVFCTALASISVDPGNPSYQSIDGVLYSKDGKTLHTYPAGKSGTSYPIPSSVTSIGDEAFAGCALTSVVIPNSVTSMGDYAFFGCARLASVTIPASVASIGDSAFNYCTGLTSVTIDNSVTSIGDYAFDSCNALVSVALGNSVTSIGRVAFHGCTGLTSIVIPSSVTSIGDYTFYGCTSLKIYCEATSEPSGWVEQWGYTAKAIYWYSETEQAGYWHYVSGVPTLW